MKRMAAFCVATRRHAKAEKILIRPHQSAAQVLKASTKAVGASNGAGRPPAINRLSAFRMFERRI
jgi:hypothetical protein